MTFKIEILTETGAEARQQMALFLGLPFAPISTLVPNTEPLAPNRAPKTDTATPFTAVQPDVGSLATGESSTSATSDGHAAALFPTVLAEPSVQTAIRKRGEPSPGKARRTKAEIAEDETAEDRAPATRYFYHPESECLIATEDGSHPGTDGLVEEISAKRYAAIKLDLDKAEASISTGEERVDPNAEQDAADEAAEAAASRTSDAPTLDDVRQLMGAVQRKHGMATAAKIPQLLGKGVAELTDAELPDALARIQTLLDGDTPASALSADPTPSAPPATKQDLIKAMLDYALFADGQNTDQAKMPNCRADVPIVFEKLFGVKTLSEVPADGYGKAVAGIAEMKAKDPFKRGAK